MNRAYSGLSALRSQGAASGISGSSSAEPQGHGRCGAAGAFLIIGNYVSDAQGAAIADAIAKLAKPNCAAVLHCNQLALAVLGAGAGLGAELVGADAAASEASTRSSRICFCASAS